MFVAGDICIGLSIFGIELKSSAMSPVDGLLSNPINLSDIAKGRNGEQGEESALSRTSSFGTDSSIEYSNFVDKPASSKQTVMHISSTYDPQTSSFLIINLLFLRHLGCILMQ